MHFCYLMSKILKHSNNKTRTQTVATVILAKSTTMTATLLKLTAWTIKSTATKLTNPAYDYNRWSPPQQKW